MAVQITRPKRVAVGKPSNLTQKHVVDALQVMNLFSETAVKLFDVSVFYFLCCCKRYLEIDHRLRHCEKICIQYLLLLINSYASSSVIWMIHLDVNRTAVETVIE